MLMNDATYILGNWSEQKDFWQVILGVARNLSLQNYALREAGHRVGCLLRPFTVVRWANIAHNAFDCLERHCHEVGMNLSQLRRGDGCEAAKVHVLHNTRLGLRIVWNDLYAIPVVLNAHRTNGAVDDLRQFRRCCLCVPILHTML